MKVHPVGRSIDFAKRAVLFLPLKLTGPLLNLNIFLDRAVYNDRGLQNNKRAGFTQNLLQYIL